MQRWFDRTAHTIGPADAQCSKLFDVGNLAGHKAKLWQQTLHDQLEIPQLLSLDKSAILSWPDTIYDCRKEHRVLSIDFAHGAFTQAFKVT